jgi:DNA (cytosine-5)-methyltransferase 1
MNFGSLFCGIGGFDLGLERAGMHCEWQVEIDPYARRVLEKHWPRVRRHDDIRTFPPAGEWGVDLVCGGFPCQPVSHAGKRKGTADDRWLWPEFARVLRLLRPRYAILENTPGILTCGFNGILGDLAEMGFDADWGFISAEAFGAAIKRERFFLVAFPAGIRCKTRHFLDSSSDPFAAYEKWNMEWDGVSVRSDSPNLRRIPDPRVLRVAHGVSEGLDRLRCLGNAVVPQCAEYIGRIIMESEAA